MKIPATIPGLKLAIGLLGLYVAVWMALEGALVRDLLLAAATLAIAMIYFGTRFFGGRSFRSAGRWRCRPRLVWPMAWGWRC